jgi:hypothetical protein
MFLFVGAIFIQSAAASLTDTDGDLYTDAFETYHSTDPYDSNNKPACCGGGNGKSDLDEFMNGAEWAAGTDHTDSGDYPDDGIAGGTVDTDGDGLYDQEEYYMYGTDITDTDTDDDQISDYDEVKANCCNNPLEDNDDDGCSNQQEFLDRTDLNDDSSYGNCGQGQGAAVSIEGGAPSRDAALLIALALVAVTVGFWYKRKY